LVFSQRGRNPWNGKWQAQVDCGQQHERPRPTRPGWASGWSWIGAGWQWRRGRHEDRRLATASTKTRGDLL
jgi:hypothetical protein